jgi:hypothetical protein
MYWTKSKNQKKKGELRQEEYQNWQFWPTVLAAPASQSQKFLRARDLRAIDTSLVSHPKY